MRSRFLQHSISSFGLLALASLSLGLVLAMPAGGDALWLIPGRILGVIAGAILLSTPGLFVGLSFSSLAPGLETFLLALQKAARASAWIILGLLPALAFVLAAAKTRYTDSFLVAAPLVFIASLLFVRSMSRSLLKNKATQTTPLNSEYESESEIESKPVCKQNQASTIVDDEAPDATNIANKDRPKFPPLEQQLITNHASAWLVFLIWEGVFLGIGLIDYIHVFTAYF